YGDWRRSCRPRSCRPGTRFRSPATAAGCAGGAPACRRASAPAGWRDRRRSVLRWSCGAHPVRALGVGLVDQQVARLALEIVADRVQRLEADALHAAGLEQTEIGLGDADMRSEILGAGLAQRQHDVEADDDRHLQSPQTIWLCSSARRSASASRRATKKSRPLTSSISAWLLSSESWRWWRPSAPPSARWSKGGASQEGGKARKG